MAVKSSTISLAFWFVLLGVGLSAPFIFGSDFPYAKKQELAEFGEAPRIILTDSDGAEFDTARAPAKVRIVSFFFSSCEGICPAMNGRIASLNRLYQNDPAIELLSITIDPETDTPEVLKRYAQRFEADTRKWRFLTGPKDRIREILDAGFRLVTSDDRNLHTTRVVLVDSAGKIRGYYQGMDDDLMARVSQDIDALR